MKKADKAPKKRSVLKGSKTATVLEMIFSLMTIPLALEYITREYKGGTVTRELRIDISLSGIIRQFLILPLTFYETGLLTHF